MPSGEERKKAPLPAEAEPIALHMRLSALEKTSRLILRRLGKSHRALKEEVAEGFRKCSESRPCAKPPAPALEWGAWGPILQRVLVGAMVAGSLIGGFVLGPAAKKDAQTQPTITAPALTAPGGK